MFKPNTIHSVLKPAFYSTKILGFTPFSLSGSSSNVVSVLDLIWSLSVMFFLGGSAFFSLSNRADGHALITKVTDYLHTHLSVINMCGGMLFACIYRKKIIGVVNDLSLVDKQLKVLDLEFDIMEKYRKNKIYLSLSTLALWAYIVWLFILDILTFTKVVTVISVGEVIAYVCPIITVFVELQFCAFVLLLNERFSWLNSKMAELAKYFGRNVNHKGHKKLFSAKVNPISLRIQPLKFDKDKVLGTMHQISIQHHELCTISKKLNQAYSFQILLIVIQAFMTIIAISFYFAKLSFSNSFDEMSADQRIYYANMLILEIAAVMVIVVSCSNTTKEAQKTGVLLHNVVSLNVFIDAGNLDLGVACFSLQLLHHNVKFTACRLFIIDETLLYSIVGAATTYLVIVLQFELGVSNAVNGEKHVQGCLNNCTIK